MDYAFEEIKIMVPKSFLYYWTYTNYLYVYHMSTWTADRKTYRAYTSSKKSVLFVRIWTALCLIVLTVVEFKRILELGVKQMFLIPEGRKEILGTILAQVICIMLIIAFKMIARFAFCFGWTCKSMLKGIFITSFEFQADAFRVTLNEDGVNEYPMLPYRSFAKIESKQKYIAFIYHPDNFSSAILLTKKIVKDKETWNTLYHFFKNTSFVE